MSWRGGVDRVDPGEQAGVEQDRVLVGGQRRGQLGIELAHPSVESLATRLEKTCSTRRSTAPLRSSASIVFANVAGVGVRGDRGDLRELLCHPGLEGGAVVLEADPVERRVLVVERAGLGEGVVLGKHPPILSCRPAALQGDSG